MKKYIILLVFLFVLTSCFGAKTDNKTLKELKDEILSVDTSSDNKDVDNSGSLEKPKERSEVFKNNLSQKYLTEEKFIEFDDLQVSDFDSLEKEITGKTLVNVDKIVVNFSNPDSNFPNDSFQLKKFKSGDKAFLYRAFKKYETIDYGENIYVFEAYSGEKVSKLELKISIFEEEKEPVSLENLPESSAFGSPKELGNGNITYTDIKGLEIENVGDIDLELDSESITNYLQEKINTWFYWNTSRYIKDETGVSFYVVSKDGENYKYEKHYYNGNGLYGILELDLGELDIGEDDEVGEILKEKNKELLEKNKDFEITDISDILFKKLTN